MFHLARYLTSPRAQTTSDLMMTLESLGAFALVVMLAGLLCGVVGATVAYSRGA